MRWSFDIPGQPVSWNAAYQIGKVVRTGRGGRLRLGTDGRPVERRKIIKTDEAVAYTTEVTLRARGKKPRGWAPTGFVVVELEYYLGTDVDCDNVMKLVGDGLEAAGVVEDDRWLLPRASWKITGLRPNQRKIRVTLDDQPVPFESPSSELLG